MGIAFSDPLRVAANTSTGNQTLTFTWADNGSYTPKAVMLLVTRCVTDGTAADGAGIYFGLSDGTNEAAGSREVQHGQASMNSRLDQDTTADRILTIRDGTATSTVEATADFVSFGTNNCTINWTDAPAAAYLIHAMAFSGTDLSVKVGSQDLGAVADALIANTSVGFEADVVFVFLNHSGSNLVDGTSIGFVHNNRAGTVTQRCQTYVQRDDFSSSACGLQMRSGNGLAKLIPGNQNLDFTGTFQSFDSSGWDVQLGNARTPINMDYSYLALRFGTSPAVSSKVYTYTTPTATGSHTDTNPNFTPQFVMYLPGRAATADTGETDADAGTYGLMITSDGATYTASNSDEDGATDSNTQSLSDNQLNLPTHTGASGHQATLTSMGSTGPVWNYSATDATARLWPALAIQAEAVAAKAPPPRIRQTRIINRSY